MKSFFSKKWMGLLILALLAFLPCSELRAQEEEEDFETEEGMEAQEDDAVEAIESAPALLADAGVGNLLDSLTSYATSRGLHFKQPVISPGFTYTASHDTSPGGFRGNTFSGDIAMDADIYDGLIAGVLYQRVSRGASNNRGVKDGLNADGASLYFGKRLFDLLNLGASYNHVETRHRLTGSLNANLDSVSDGYTILAGISDKKGKWSWSTTTSFTYSNDDYDQKQTIQTGRFGWSTGLFYDVTPKFTLGAAATYYNFVFQDTFGGPARDDDYYNIGPKFIYYVNDRTTLKVDFDSQQGYKDFGAYSLRVVCDISL